MNPQNDTGVKIETREIPLSDIEPNPWQPRSVFPIFEMKQLSESIKNSGLVQSIAVRPHPMDQGRYQIIAGERRWRACRMAGLKTIRAEVREATDESMEELAALENMARSNMNPIDEAGAVKKMLDRGKPIAEIARAVGRSKSSLEAEQNLLRLPREIQQEVIKGRISKRVAIEIGKLETTLHWKAFDVSLGRMDESAINRIRIIDMASREQSLFDLTSQDTKRAEFKAVIERFQSASNHLLAAHEESKDLFILAASDRPIITHELDLLIRSLKKIRQDVGLMLTYRTTQQEEKEKHENR